MHTDEQYGRRLGVELRRELAEVRAAPDLIRTLRRRQARRTWAVRAVIVTPMAAGAAAAVLVATAGPGTPDRGPVTAAQPSSSSVPLLNVAYVRAQTVKALGQASEYVIFAKTTYSSGYHDMWIDKATQRYRNDVYGSSGTFGGVGADGTVQAPPAPGQQSVGPIHLMQSHAVTGPDGDQDIITVDYDTRWWATDHLTHTRPPTAPPDITDADSIRKAIADGVVELVGNETVGGRDTLHLRLYGPNRSYRIDMWVDSTTYLPVQGTAAKSAGASGDFPATETTTYTWLPRTPENLAHLVLTPPPGFAER